MEKEGGNARKYESKGDLTFNIIIRDLLDIKYTLNIYAVQIKYI